MTRPALTLEIVTLLVLVCCCPRARAERITEHLTFERGTINRVVIQRDGAAMAVYDAVANDESTAGSTQVELLLLPHGRRDLAWTARPWAARGTRIVAPARERFGLEQPDRFWDNFVTSRFHDYAQQSTKFLAEPLPVARWVKDGDVVTWRDVELRVIETPSFTRGSVSYVTRLDGKTIAFTGDLIHGQGQILDLYSFQDDITEAQIRGYHGYGSRLAGLVESLRKVAAESPDLLVPARGPLIRNPDEAIDKLIDRVQEVYANYLSTNALHWYFKEERMRQCGRRVLGDDARIELMPYSHYEKTPSWVFEHSTSRMLVSESGDGFLLDCGYQRVIDAVEDLMRKGIVKKVEGIFVTHFHDDHTDMVQAAAEKFRCPVYATAEYADVLRNPGSYHLPALTANPIKDVTVMADGQKLDWHEFELDFRFFPGQTYYHGALLVTRKGEKPIFFIGDAFAPSGFDDYCVLNRNLLHDDSGYLLCLRKLRGVGRDFWLVNQHIPHVFSFSEQELDNLERRYRRRIELLGELFPWDDPNYGVDEQWAVFHPRCATMTPGRRLELTMKVTNHSPVSRRFEIRVHADPALRIESRDVSIDVPPRRAGSATFHAVAAEGASGNRLITADIQSDGMSFARWADALVIVEGNNGGEDD